MAMPKKGTRLLVIDDKNYSLFLSGRKIKKDGTVPISFIAHLEDNDTAKLVVKGITSRDYWYDYPDDDKFLDGVTTITPRIAVLIIKHCIRNGWDPNGNKQVHFDLDKQALDSIIEST